MPPRRAQQPVPSSALSPVDCRADFKRRGYTIVRGAISPERAAYYRQQQLAWLEGFNLGFDVNDKSTWRKDFVPANFKDG